jgi:hypothetical protein
MTYESKFKLTVEIDEFLNRVVVGTKTEHLVDQELETEVAAGLL